MKKSIISILIVLAILTSCQKQESKIPSEVALQAQQPQESAVQHVQADSPVYIDFDDHEFLVCDFALNKVSNDSIKLLEPYINKGRFYFCGLGLPLSDGDLIKGYEFSLEHDEKLWYSPRIKAVYNGLENMRINKRHGERMYLSGYAERGSIVITHVFSDVYKAEKWSNTVRWVRVF